MRISDEERRELAKKLRNSNYFVDVGNMMSTCLLSLTRAANELGLEHECNYLTMDGVSRLADLIDRPTCRNVYDESKAGACENGFECSECGNVVEDGEGWLVNGTFNYCSECGREVVGDDD